MAKSPRMRLFLLQQFWTGVSIAYYSGTLTPLISDTMEGVSNSTKLERSMNAMVVFGLGEVVGGLITGQIIDFKGSKFVAAFNVVVMAVTMGITLLFIGYYEYSALVFIMTFLWGF